MKNYNIETFITKNKETIAYRKTGNHGPYLVFIHGNMSSSIFYQDAMEQLENEYQIITPDMRGFGDSSYHQEVSSLKEFGNDLIELLDHLQVDACYVVGWSTGGGVALEMAASQPDRFKKVFLLDSVGLMGYPMFKKDEKGQPILNELITTKAEVAADMVQVVPILHAYTQKDKAMMQAIWNALIYNLKQPAAEDYDLFIEAMFKQRNLVDVDYSLITFNITDQHNGVVAGNNRIKDIKAPIVIIHGEKDLVVPVSYAHQMKEFFKDQAELIVLSHTGHSLLTDDLAEFVGIIRKQAV